MYKLHYDNFFLINEHDDDHYDLRKLNGRTAPLLLKYLAYS